MTRRPARLCAVAVGLCAALALVGSTARADEQALTSTATPNQGKPGALLQVAGSGWPAQTQVQLSTCGGLAIEGSVACDQQTITVASTSPDGALQVQVPIGKPPTPCPCVLRVSAFGTGKAVNIPVQVRGHPSAPLPNLPTPPAVVQVASSAVEEPFSWAALFGAAAPRVLELTYRNTGTLPAAAPATILTVEPLGGAARALPMPAAEMVPAGGELTVEVPFELDPGIGGSYLVRGTVPGQPGFSHQTSSWAWGFFALDAILFVLLVAVLLTKALRARSPEPQRGSRHAGRSSPSPGRHSASSVASGPGAGIVPLDELYSTD